MNKRILVIDDEETVRESFLRILVPQIRDESAMDSAAELLFGGDSRSAAADAVIRFDVRTASSGAQGVELVRSAVQEETPFAVIFCDMRMPGMDGLATVEKIRELDTRAEIVFVTAYSDHSIEEVVRRSGPNVSYFCKPFVPEEIRQLATKGVHDWEKARNLENLIGVVGRLQGEPGDVEHLLRNILHQVAGMLSSNSAMIVRCKRGGGSEWVLGSGQLGQAEEAAGFLKECSTDSDRPFHVQNGCACFDLGEFKVVALCDGENTRLSLERGYLVTIFLEQASQILRNLELEQALIRKEQLSAVGQAISMAAHDLRSPVATIRSAVELARMDSSPENLEMALDLIVRCTDMSLELINDIRDFVRDTDLETRVFPVEDLLQLLGELASPVMKELGVELEVILSDPDLNVRGDEQKLVRVLFNLVKNAAEALNHHPECRQVVRLEVQADPEAVRFTVADQGPGIDPELLPQLFQPFTTKGKSQGTGLGLAIARRIVEKHRSSLDMETGPGGTTFSFSLLRRTR